MRLRFITLAVDSPYVNTIRPMMPRTLDTHWFSKPLRLYPCPTDLQTDEYGEADGRPLRIRIATVDTNLVL